MISKILTCIQYVIAVTLLILAVSIRSPYLLEVREYVFFVILIISSFWAAFLTYRLFSPLKNKFNVKSLLLFTLLAVACSSFIEVKFRIQKYQTLNAPNEVLKKLSQHIIIGYDAIEDLEKLILKDAIGGVFITKRNVKDKSYDEVKLEIAHMQALRLSRNMPKLLIATDQEGGIVSRLSPPLSKLPALSSLTKFSKEKQHKEAMKYGLKQGSELSELGINVNFSPVVDIKYSDEINPLDFHSLISKRAISDDKSVVANIAIAYALGLEKNKVIPTVKHFPGMGRVKDDTHHFSARLNITKDLLEKTDWMPFKHMIKEFQAFIMLGHVILSDIDEENPVSSSKTVIQQVIRDRWQYHGVLITDDVTMKSYGGKNGACKSSILSLNASVDFLLISYDFDKYYEMMPCLLQAYSNGVLKQDALKKSKLRIEKVTEKIWGISSLPKSDE